MDARTLDGSRLDVRPGVALFASVLVAATIARGAVLQGRLRCAGSETMAPLLARWAEAFARRQPAVVVQIEDKGSRSALLSLLSGTSDIAALSRPLLPSEERMLRERFGGFRLVVAGADTLHLLARHGGAAWARPCRAAAAFRAPDPAMRTAGRLPGSGTRLEALAMLGLGAPPKGSAVLASPTALQSALRSDPALVGYGGRSILLSDIVALPGPTLPRPLVLVAPGRNPSSLASAFLAFVAADEGRSIVRSSGFAPASGTP